MGRAGRRRRPRRQATLARDLTSAAGAFATAGAALVQFADHLSHAQAADRTAEDQAAAARDQLGRLTAHLADLDQELATAPPGTHLGRLDGDRAHAQRAWAAAHGDYDTAVATAHAIQADLLAAGDAAARALHAIPGAPYQPPNLFQQAWDRIGAWVDDHADALHQLSDGLKLVAAVAGCCRSSRS